MKKVYCVLILALAVVLAARMPALRRDVRDGSAAAVRQAVLRSAAQCYAVEGAYPPSLSYLEEHYHLIVNHRDFIVSYDAFASNLPPDVRVLVRGEEGA